MNEVRFRLEYLENGYWELYNDYPTIERARDRRALNEAEYPGMKYRIVKRTVTWEVVE